MQAPPVPQPVWQEFQDQSSQAKYYYNTVTAETTWERPPAFPFASLPGAPQPTTERAPRAIQWNLVPDSDWQIVSTDSNEQYFHNTNTGTTTWDVPSEIADYVRQNAPAPSSSTPPEDVMIEDTPEDDQAMVDQEENEPAWTEEEILLQQQQMMFYPVELVEEDGEYDDEEEYEEDADELSPSDPSLPPFEETSHEDEALTGKRHREDSTPPTEAKRFASDAIPDTDTEAPSHPQDEQQQQRDFEDLLRENKVNQFSFWDMIKRKIENDPRFLAISDAKERKRLFEAYSQDKAKQQQQNKEQALQQFQLLLEQARQKNITRFSHFTETFSRSPALQTLPSSEQKKLFKEQIAQDKAAKQSRHKEAREEFWQLLRTCTSIHADSRWSSRLKDKLRDDPRYELLSSREREDAFYQYTDQLYREKKALEQQRRVGDKSRMHREHVNTRREFEAKDAEKQLAVLYSEFITKPCSWEEAQGRLLGKSRFENRLLSHTRKQELFDMHLDSLQQTQAAQFYEMLKNVVPPIVLGAIYETCQMRLQNDPRYHTVPTDEARKATFERYQSDLLRDAEKGFRALLRNMTTEITLSKSGPQFDSALEIIKKDPRWRALDLRSDRRDALLEEYKTS